MTYKEELVFVDTAIQKILQFGQASGVDGSSLSRANLKDLHLRKTELLTLIDQANRTNRFRMYGGVTL